MESSHVSDSSGVSVTALTAAAARVVESRKPERLVDDPMAEGFLAAVGWEPTVSDSMSAALGDMFAVRSRFLDQQLLRFARNGGRQVVILGAGLDTRAFRLAWPPGTSVYELDKPALLRFKETVLSRCGGEPGCRRVPVEADLAADWVPALMEAGLATSEPVAWLAEGLLLYLTCEQCDRLMGELSSLGGLGSVLLVEHLNRAAQTSQPGSAVAHQVASVGEPWRSHLDDPAGWLSRFGWDAEVHDIRELAVKYGRPIPPIVDDQDSPESMIWCVAAARRDVIREHPGEV